MRSPSSAAASNATGGSGPALSRNSGFHYQRRDVERSTLYSLVRDHLETFYQAVEEGFASAPLPNFIKQEFERFLDCGVLCRAWALAVNLASDPDRDLKLKMANQVLDEWEALVSLLPANWEQLANDHKLLETKYGNAKITSAHDLLRLILVHAAAGFPLRQTVALVAQAGGPSLSPMRLHKKMVRAGGYLHALVTAMVQAPAGLSPEKWAGYVVSMVDASVISRPGSVNGDARIHLRMRMSDLKFLQVRSTGIDVGETFCGLDFEPGELVVGDRGYSNARGVAHVLDAGADVLVRLNRTAMPLLWAATETPFDIMSALRALPACAVIEQDVLAPYKVGAETRTIRGRLCMMRLPALEASKARKRALKEHSCDVSADTLEAAGYIVLFTTTPRTRLSAAQCVELYRLRWQIGASCKGRMNQSVKVRPGLKDSRPCSLGGTVAREQGGEALRQQTSKGGCATLQVAA